MHTQPTEDIDAVIHRFQAWAGLQTAAQPNPGIRELTYEEALASRRNRWRASAKRKPENELRYEAASPHADASLPRAAKADAQHKSRSRQPRGAGRKPTATAPALNHASKASRPASVASSSAKRTTARLGPEASPQPPAFHEVLVSAVLPAEAPLATYSVEVGRQVAISIRLAAAERETLRVRAAEAGISVSAYIRQCALEMEQLRAQVKQALAAMEQQAPGAHVTPEQLPPPPPGFLTRLMRRLLPSSTPRFVLRA